MGRQARFVNWFCSSYLICITTKKTILIESTYFKTILKFLTLRNFSRYSVFRYFVTSLLVTSLLGLVTPREAQGRFEITRTISS